MRRYCGEVREILERDCGEDGTRADAISEVVQGLEIDHPGRPGYLGRDEEKILADILKVRDTMGVGWGRKSLRAHLLAVLPLMEHNHDKHITLSHSYIDTLMRRLHERDISLFSRTPTSIARASQSDPDKNKAMQAMLRARWRTHFKEKKLETRIPNGCQVFNMDEIG